MSNMRRSPLTFGHDLFGLVFAHPNGPKKDFKYMQEAQWFFLASLGNVSCKCETHMNYHIAANTRPRDVWITNAWVSRSNMISKAMLTAKQFILVWDIATTKKKSIIHTNLICCKKSEKKLVALSARSQMFHCRLIFGHSFWYTDFIELYVLLIGWQRERLPGLFRSPHGWDRERIFNLV